jgi:hypothetical protein
MGLADFLSSALTVGTQAAGAHQSGLAERKRTETADLLDQIKLARQKQQDEMARQLQEAQIGNYKSLAEDRARPAPDDVQVVEGQLVNRTQGTAKPIAGYVAPDRLKQVTEEAEARAKASAKYRAPSSDSDQNSRRIAIRQAVQADSQKYMSGERDFMGNVTGSLPPLEARQQAMKNAIEIYGADAVRDAVGGAPVMPARPAAPLRPAGAPPAAGNAPAKAQPKPADVIAWRDANPRQAGESDQAYKARAMQAFGATP